MQMVLSGLMDHYYCAHKSQTFFDINKSIRCPLKDRPSLPSNTQKTDLFIFIPDIVWASLFSCRWSLDSSILMI